MISSVSRALALVTTPTQPRTFQAMMLFDPIEDSTEADVGSALAMRDLMADLRQGGEVTGGPKPFSQKDRSAFLSALDVAINRLKRAGFGSGAP